MKVRTPLAVVVALVALVCLGQAEAATLRVVSAAAAKGPLVDGAAAFKEQSGDDLSFSFGTAGQVRDRASSGAFDIVVAPPAVLSALAEKSIVDPSTKTDLGAVVLAAAVPAASKVAAPSDLASLKKLILNAPTIGLANPKTGATSGIFLDQLLHRLGVYDSVAPRLRLFADGQDAVAAVAKGPLFLALGQSSEVAAVRGVRSLGPLPAAAQLRTIYSAALTKSAVKSPAAKAFMAFLQSSRTKAALRAHGFAAAK